MKFIKPLTYSFFLIVLFNSCSDKLIGDEGQYDEDVFLNYQTKTDLELPFEEEWFVGAGGRSVLQNHHFVGHRNQRYAVDIYQVIDGSFFSGDGTKNEDYFCFGKRINAPANGKVIAVENNVEDNIIGTTNTKQQFGNFIIIDHLNGEFSFMEHFKKSSIIVSIGDTVIKGQELGKAGNSGNSTGPHLHYHLQTTSNIDTGLGLPIQFMNYYADDVLIERGEPIQNQFVRKN
jgi:murein DD-endopeptidase MepM/ murein hydrolase activator NlpD